MEITREQKIDKIYEVIANKKLTFGCKVKYKYEKTKENSCIITKVEYNPTFTSFYTTNWYIQSEKVISEIIWHLVMIWDILHYNSIMWGNLFEVIIKWNRDNYFYENDLFINKYWNKKNKPIEDQSDECIEFIFNLIK